MSDLMSASVHVQGLVTLVYELLDAHDDTARLAFESDLDGSSRWPVHLDYLRALQREGREVLAHVCQAALA
jgi:hypothetical protein